MTFTKEQLIEKLQHRISVASGFPESEKAQMDLELARIALASLEAEPVGYMNRFTGRVFTLEEQHGADTDVQVYMPVYTAPPAPVSVPDFKKLAHELVENLVDCDGADDSAVKQYLKWTEKTCRAAMLQGKAEPVREKVLIAQMESIITDLNLPDDASLVDISNEILRLQGKAEPLQEKHQSAGSTGNCRSNEKVQENNAGSSDEPVSQHPELTVWYGSMPESNGKTNWTAILHRKGEGIQDGMTIDRSEYPDRVLYEADRVRYLIGEKADRPCILDYDADAHSGYVKPGNSPATPDGWVACSERMPETAGNYWGWWSESKRQGPVWFIKSELQAQFQSSEITHWMPLPAAPQQEAE